MIYAIGKLIFIIYYGLFFQVRAKGRENVPKTGGVIICANHISVQDPLVIAITNKRWVHYISKKELYKKKFFAMVLRSLGAVPIDRGKADMNAMRAGIDILKKGEVMGIFAQGHRMKESDIRGAKAGVAFFAMSSGAVVVPAHISSTYKFFSRIKVTYGKPMDFTEFKDKRLRASDLAQITELIMNEVALLGVGEEEGKTE